MILAALTADVGELASPGLAVAFAVVPVPADRAQSWSHAGALLLLLDPWAAGEAAFGLERAVLGSLFRPPQLPQICVDLAWVTTIRV